MLRDPMHPRIVGGQFAGDFLRNPRCVAIQFRYAFVTDDDGLSSRHHRSDATDSGSEAESFG